MLNLIADYKQPDSQNISKVSGIPKNWNRSAYNIKKSAADSFYELVSAINSRYVLVSFNSEGFISFDQMVKMLQKYGEVKTVEINYNTFRGSRNLQNRSIHVSEYLFVLEK